MLKEIEAAAPALRGSSSRAWCSRPSQLCATARDLCVWARRDHCFCQNCTRHITAQRFGQHYPKV